MIIAYDEFYIQENAQIQTALRKVGQDGLDDVYDAESLYNWMRNSYLPHTLKSTSNPKGQHFQSVPHFQIMYQTPLLMTSNTMTQTRRHKPTLCSKKSAIAQDPTTINIFFFLGIDCSDEEAEAKPFGHVVVNNTVLKTCPHTDQFKRFKDGQVVLQNPFELNLESNEYTISDIVPEYINYLQDCGWIDARTSTIVLTSAVFIPGHAAFGELHTTFEFSEFGNVITTKRSCRLVPLLWALRYKSMMDSETWSNDDLLYMWAGKAAYISLVKIYFIFVGLVQNCCEGWTRAGKKKQTKTTCSAVQRMTSFFSLSMLFDLLYLLQLVYFLIRTYEHDRAMLHAMDTISKAGSTITSANAKVLSQEWMMAWISNYKDIATIISECLLAVQNIKTAMVIYLLSLFIELMRHFSGNKKLSVVPRSLAVSAVDLGYLLVVLFFITFIFAVVLSIWYGEQFVQFSTLESTMVHLVLMTLGDWSTDFWEIYNECDAPMTFFFIFLSYCLLVIIVVMNMVLAVVLDAYSQVKEFQAAEEIEESQVKEHGTEEDWNKLQEQRAKQSMASLMQMVRTKGRGGSTDGGGSTGNSGDLASIRPAITEGNL